MTACTHEYWPTTRRGIPIKRGAKRGFVCKRCGDFTHSVPMIEVARSDARKALPHFEAALVCLAEVRGGPVGIGSAAIDAEQRIRDGIAFCEKLLLSDQTAAKRQ